MKIRSSLRKVCASCKLVKRGRKNFVICSANARHKQRQGLHTLAAPAAAGLPASSVPALSSLVGAAAWAPMASSLSPLVGRPGDDDL